MAEEAETPETENEELILTYVPAGECASADPSYLRAADRELRFNCVHMALHSSLGMERTVSGVLEDATRMFNYIVGNGEAA